MENMEHVYKAEAEALRRYYQKTRDAVNELEDTLRLLQKDRRMPLAVGKAINELLELNNE